jgi:hypothetical protein
MRVRIVFSIFLFTLFCSFDILLPFLFQLNAHTLQLMVHFSTMFLYLQMRTLITLSPHRVDRMRAPPIG